MSSTMYQVSTLQALALGYTRPVTTVSELVRHGNIGLGTFENVDGEMIILDGECYRAAEDGSASPAPGELGVPFASVTNAKAERLFDIDDVADMETLKTLLTLTIEEDFALNSMHIIRIDGHFNEVSARSESAYKSAHVDLKDILAQTQKDFAFEDISGTLVCVYYPDYMDGINAPGWHVHFLSEDRKKGGHVFGIVLDQGKAKWTRINNIEIALPQEPAFDTYALKGASQDDIKEVEQGNG
ncbi:MAG: acetolactate decarboxylase [Bacillota bacterium]|nr:acetolactate decarboxylase [Bacillota bacterium]